MQDEDSAVQGLIRTLAVGQDKFVEDEKDPLREDLDVCRRQMEDEPRHLGDCIGSGLAQLRCEGLHRSQRTGGVCVFQGQPPGQTCRAVWLFQSATGPRPDRGRLRSEEHTSELQSLRHLVCRLLLEKKTHHTSPSTPSFYFCRVIWCSPARTTS